jgi:hypothetical protein
MGVSTQMFLTADELVELTDSHRRQDQAKWLLENRFVFFYSRLGNIKVLRGMLMSSSVARRCASTCRLVSI